jgi:MFS family permease
MKLNYKRTFLVGLAFLSISAFWQLYDNLVPLILTETFGMGETLRGVIMAADNVLALFLLPLFGTLSDKTRTPLGRRTPFIIAGTAIAVTFMLFLPSFEQKNNLTLFLIGLGVVLLAMGSYRSPAVALMPDLTPKPLRSKANAVINLMGALGGVYTLIMVKFLISKEDRPDYLPVFTSVAVLMVVAVLLLVLTVRERRLSAEIAAMEEPTEEKKSPSATAARRKLPPDVLRSLVFLLISVFAWFMAYNAVTTAFSSYALEVWGLKGGDFADCLMVATVAAVISYIPVGFIAGKIGRKKTILTGILLMFAAYVGGVFFKTYHPLANVMFAAVGIGWAFINVNSYPMVVEMSSHGDVGRYTGLYYTFSMSAQILTPILSGFFLEYFSYATLFPYAAIFMVIAFCTMLMVKHGDVKPTPKKDLLESFDAGDE